MDGYQGQLNEYRGIPVGSNDVDEGEFNKGVSYNLPEALNELAKLYRENRVRTAPNDTRSGTERTMVYDMFTAMDNPDQYNQDANVIANKFIENFKAKNPAEYRRLLSEWSGKNPAFTWEKPGGGRGNIRDSYEDGRSDFPEQIENIFRKDIVPNDNEYGMFNTIRLPNSGN